MASDTYLMMKNVPAAIHDAVAKVEHTTITMLSDFKTFISKGNVMDLAVGVIIGGAFQGIVNSLVKDVITPALTLVTATFFHGKGPVDFQSLAIGAHQVIQNGHVIKDPDGNPLLQGGIMIGSFINNVVSFFILAGVVFFLLVKPMNRLMAAINKPVPPAGAPPPPEDIVLLRAILDSLKNPPAPKHRRRSRSGASEE